MIEPRSVLLMPGRHLAFLRLLLLVLSCLGASVADRASAQTTGGGEYVALVVANGHVGAPLSTEEPLRAAGEVERRLRVLGFRLVSAAVPGGCGEGGVQLDLSQRAMLAALTCLEASGKGAKQIVFYFSGYAAQVDGKSYLVPLGVDVSKPLEGSQLIDLASISEALARVKPELSVIVVDGPRAGLKSIATKGVGLGRLPSSGSPRVVAYSAPLNAWAEDGPSEPTGGQPTPPISAYSARLVEALDADLDMRTLGLPGLNVAALFGRAAAPAAGGKAAGQAAALEVEDVPSNRVLGRAPTLGTSMCDTLVWRAEAFGNCLELAAAFQHCGKKPAVRQRVAAQCPQDLQNLIRVSLRSSLAGALKANTCAGFKTLFDEFDSDPSANLLAEYKEAKSLGQYKCSLEARETMKKDFDQAISKRDCRGAQQLLSTSRDELEADMRKGLEKLVGEVCCPSVSLEEKCLSRGEAIARFTSMLEEKGCTMGRNKSAKATRTSFLMEQVNTSASLGLSLKSNGLSLDSLWTRMKEIPVAECSCGKKEVLSDSGACSSRK